MRLEAGGWRLETAVVAVLVTAALAVAGPSPSVRPSPRPSVRASVPPAPASPSLQPPASSLQPPASLQPAPASELPPEPPPVQQAQASELPPDPAEVAAHAAVPAAPPPSGLSLGSIVLLVLLAGCGAGCIWLGARVKELDERYSRLKEMMARLDDGHEALQKRLPASERPARQAASQGASSPGAVVPDVSGAVEKAVQGALADTRARLEQVDQRSERLSRDLSQSLAPALDEIRRKLGEVERRVADGQRNPFSTGGGSASPAPAASAGDPVSALAAGLARASCKLAPRPAGSAPADAAAQKMADAIGGLEQGLAGVESATGSGGPLERDVADLAQRLRQFVQGVRARAGQAGDDWAPPMSLDQFVSTYADRIPEEARKRPAALLDLYFDTVSRVAGKGGVATPALSEQDALAQVFTYVDTLHGLRAKASDWDSRSGGGEALGLALDRLFEDFRGFLRSYSISIVAPEPGQVPDATLCRVTQSVPRPNAQPNTVVHVIGCGFKNTMNGQVLRMAEVITAS